MGRFSSILGRIDLAEYLTGMVERNKEITNRDVYPHQAGGALPQAVWATYYWSWRSGEGGGSCRLVQLLRLSVATHWTSELLAGLDDVRTNSPEVQQAIMNIRRINYLTQPTKPAEENKPKRRKKAA